MAKIAQAEFMEATLLQTYCTVSKRSGDIGRKSQVQPALLRYGAFSDMRG